MRMDRRGAAGARVLRAAGAFVLALMMLSGVGARLTASADSSFAYGHENVTGSTFTYGNRGATISGTTVKMTGKDEGEVIGYIGLDDPDLRAAVDLGGLEIDFSTVASVALEGVDGAENDVPSVEVRFCSDADVDSEISSVHLTKDNAADASDKTFSSGASIPKHTRAIFIILKGKNSNAESDNTVVFHDTSLVIRDSGAPSCQVSYNDGWTNAPVTVKITASDSDSGIEGIYKDGVKVASESPYEFVVSENNTSFSVYSRDYAGKTSDTRSVTIDKIDTSAPAAPASIVLSSTDWTNADVLVTLPALGASSGAPERYVYSLDDAAWKDLPENYSIKDDGQHLIKVAVADEAGNISGSVQAAAKIDKHAPKITGITQTVGSGSCRVDVTATDNGLSGVDKMRYAAGEHDEAYFLSGGGTDISGNTFTVASGGKYTIFVSDKAGNTDIAVETLNTAPTLADIADQEIYEDTPVTLTLAAADAETALEDLDIDASTSDGGLLSVAVRIEGGAASLTVTPKENRFGGPATVTVTVRDEQGKEVSDTFAVTVAAVNDAPAAADDPGEDDPDITTPEDTSVKINVLANDSDEADGDTLTVIDVGSPAHGTAAVVLGEIKYTPARDFSGDDSFTYTISDGHEGTDTAVVSVTVINANDAPRAADDAATVDEDGSVTIDVLANDTDPDLDAPGGDTLSIGAVTNGLRGTAVLHEGKILYTPAADYSGADKFTYELRDAEGLVSTGTVTVAVAAVPDDPAFVGLNETYTIDEDSVKATIAFSIRDVETGAKALMLQAVSKDETLLPASGLIVSGLGDADDAVTLLITPEKDAFGDVTIKLSLSDGFATVERSFTLHVRNVNDAPTPADDEVRYDEDSPGFLIETSALLANDTDPENDELSFVGIGTLAGRGALEAVDEDTLRYTPPANFTGTVSFTYEVTDGSSVAAATCRLVGEPANDAPKVSLPVAEFTGGEDAAVTGIAVTISDEETAAANLTVTGSSGNTDLVAPDGISIVNNKDGTCTLAVTPLRDASGTATITVLVSDGEDSAEAEFTVSFLSVQDKPKAEDDSVYVPLSGRRTFAVLENDHDVDGDALTVTGYDDDELKGTLVFDATTQLFTYYAAVGEVGTGTFTYTISDGRDAAAALVTLDIHSVATAPVISPIADRYIDEDGTAGGIGFSVQDADYGDVIAVTVASNNGELLPAGSMTVGGGAGGEYTLSLVPAANKYGTATVAVTATDKAGKTDQVQFTLTVTAVNDPPVAVDDSFTVDEDYAVALTLTGNDTDADGDTLWIAGVTGAKHGTVSVTSAGYFYTPYDNAGETEKLTYTVTDGIATDEGTVTITVVAVNDAPVAWPDWRELPNSAGASADIAVLGNDYDVEGDTLRLYEIVTQPRYGTATANADGTVTYTRGEISPEGNGADSFTYRIIDRASAEGDYGSAVGTVHIGVEFTSSLYAGYPDTITCFEDDPPFTFALPIHNPNGVNYTLTLNGTTALGALEVVDSTHVRFSPAADKSGTATISYTASQVGGGESCTGSFTLRVYPVNDLPAIDSAPETAVCDEDSGGVSFDVLFHDLDCADADLKFYAYLLHPVSGTRVPFSAAVSVDRNAGKATVTVAPGENVNGSADIVLIVTDGLAAAQRTVKLTVRPVDDPPAILYPLSATLHEDMSVVFRALSSRPDVDGDDTSIAILSGNGPAHGVAGVDARGIVTYKPNADYFGEDLFYLTVTDLTEAARSTQKAVQITVLPVNDQPEITGLAYYQTAPEDTEKDVYFTVSDVDSDLSAASCYTIASENTALVKSGNITVSKAADGRMKLHIVPEQDAFGTSVITILASDGELTAKAEFKLTVTAVNDAPVAVDDPVTADEAVGDAKTVVTIPLTGNDSDAERSALTVSAITDLSKGTAVNIGGGSVRLTVDGDYSGTVTFSYTVLDAGGAADTADVTVTIRPKNDPPRARADSATATEDHSVTIPVLGNDTDAESDELSVLSVTSCSNGGTATVSGTDVVYAPVANYSGQDTFSYTVSDPSGGTATALVTVTIKPVNDPPAVSKYPSDEVAWTVAEDAEGAFHFVASDPETAAENLILTIRSLNEKILKSSAIVLSKNDDGYRTITVRPEKDQHGEVYIKFTVSDGAWTKEVSFELIVTPVNDAPAVEPQAVTTREDTRVSSKLVASDIDGDALTFAKKTDPAHGTVTVNDDGTYTYTPQKDFSGIDSFLVTVSDGVAEREGRVTVTVTPENDAPVAADDEKTTDEDVPAQIDALKNDTDADIDPDADIPDDFLTISAVACPAHGTAVISADKKSITYTPSANWNGTETFSYTISDDNGRTDSATITVIVRPVNDAPSGGDDTAATDEDQSVTIAVTENDDLDEGTNPDREDVKVVSVAKPEHGTATISADEKSIVYTPGANWFSPAGSPEVFSYTARDSGNIEATFTVAVTVRPVNDAPVIHVASAAELPDLVTLEDTAVGPVQFTVSDIEDAAGSLTVTVKRSNSALLPALSAPPDASGACSFTLTPNANKIGSATITVTVRDSAGATDEDAFTLTVTQVNDPPAAQNDAATTKENESISVDVLANDDVDTLSGNGTDTLTLLSFTAPSSGTAAIEGNKLKFTPDATCPDKDSYTVGIPYQMKDASGATSGATLTVTVTPVNDKPAISAVADTAITEDKEGGTGAIEFAVTDEEDDDDTLAVSVACTNTTLFPLANITVANPHGANGTERTVTAVPAANQFGTATITLTVTDSQGLSSAEEFTVTVAPVDDRPENGDDQCSVTEDVETQLFVLANDDPDYATTPDELTIENITTDPAHGKVRIAPDKKSVYYLTDKDGNLPDSFVYQMHDTGNDGDYSFTVNITVIPVNDAPVVTLLDAEHDSYTVKEGFAKNDIPFQVTDVDNNVDAGLGLVEVAVSAESSNKLLLKYGLNIDVESGCYRNIDVTPYQRWNGTAIVTITAMDKGGLTGTARFTFIVDSVNEAPVANDDAFTIDEDASANVSVLVNDTDGDRITNPDTEKLTIAALTNNSAANAAIAIAANGTSVDIRPNANFNGTLTFTYVVQDTAGAPSNTATATVTVLPVNDAPVADNEAAGTNEDAPVTIDVLDGDTDVDKDPALNAHPMTEPLTISLSQADLKKPSHGGIKIEDGKILYTPTPNFNGPDTFEYNASDGTLFGKGTVTVTVNQVNDNPNANADTTLTDEDTPVTFGVLGNDTDVDTDALLNLGTLHRLADFRVTSASVDDVKFGVVTVGADYRLTYTPAANYFDKATLSYTLDDGQGGTATGHVTVTVRSVNDLPQFTTPPANLAVDEDGQVSGNIVVSDVETVAGSLAVTVISSSNTALIEKGGVTVTVGADGARTVTAKPKANQHGSSVITLRVTDGNGGYKECTFTLTVNAVNDTPAANDAAYPINEGASKTFAGGLLSSDVDIATTSDSLTYSIVTQGKHGTATVAANGDITYTPAHADWNGVDSFVYQATDKSGAFDTGTVTITVQQVNDAPVADDDAAATDEDVAVTIDVLNGDTDVDKDAALNAYPEAEVLSVSIAEVGLIAPSHGRIEIVDGGILYTPDANFNGTDTFEYNVSDDEALDKGTVTVTIAQVNDNPNAVADSASTPDETPVFVNVLANDTDVDTDALLNLAAGGLHTKDAFRVDSFAAVGTLHGTLTEKDGVITFTPELNFVGTQKISYVLSDGHGGTATGTLTILVDSENDAPKAYDDTLTTDEDTAGTENVLANDYDQDPGDALSFTGFTADTASLPGTFATGADGAVTFTPRANYHGTFTIGYQMRDAGGLTSEATLTVVVNAVNDTPTAASFARAATEDTALSIDVSGQIGDADIITDGDSLTVSLPSGRTLHGTVMVSGYEITYTPDENWNGTDSIAYVVTDKAGKTAAATITVTAAAVNDAPVAADDTAALDEDGNVLIGVLANDSDIDTLAALNASPQPQPFVSAVGAAAHGTVAIEAGGVRYTPAENYNGPDSFTYTLSDGTLTATATVRVTVKQVNDAPDAVDDAATTPDEDEVIIDVLINDTDVDTDAAKNLGELHKAADISIASVGTAGHGRTSIVSGKISYVPEDRYAGSDSFSYTITDGHGRTDTATVTVTVLSVNDPPAAPVFSLPVDGGSVGGSSTVQVRWTGFDIDGDALTYTLEYYDGSAWHVVSDSLSATDFAFAIPAAVASTPGLQFRAKASDGEYTSGYGYSGKLLLDKDPPASVVVTMRTADGKTYTPGKWTNQSVTVTAVSASDVSSVSFQYALEDRGYAAGSGKVVTSGVHNVYVLATDAFGNAREFGGYLARVDKQPPAEPTVGIESDGEKATIKLTLLADPGGSGNDTLTFPDGTKAAAGANLTWTAKKNGVYTFTLTDVAGNSRTFTVNVTAIDTTKPLISCDAGGYRTGSVSIDPITAALTYTDAESRIVAKGYELTSAKSPSGAYRSDADTVTMRAPGTYYIHAYAKNAAGVESFETFGPFVIEASATAPGEVPGAAEPTPEPGIGDVVIDKNDIPGLDDGVKGVRLPGAVWSDTVTLTDAVPGTYVVEVLGDDGSVRTVEIEITPYDIVLGAARPRPEQIGVRTAAMAGGAALLALLLLALLGWNVRVQVFGPRGADTRKLRTLKKLRRRKDTLALRLTDGNTRGGETATIRLSRALTKRMRGRSLVVTRNGAELLSARIPEDAKGRFTRAFRLS